MKYGLEQVGCYADGTFGHDHIRSNLALLLQGFTGRWNKTVMLSAESLMDELCADPSDDFSEEDDAIALLNEHATDDTVSFGMFEGDLMLASTAQWESEFDESIGVGTTSDNFIASNLSPENISGDDSVDLERAAMALLSGNNHGLD